MITKALGFVALAAALALPAASFAQTFAYVNTAGEVQTMEAADANTALMTAPGIGMHSGVIHLEDGTDTL